VSALVEAALRTAWAEARTILDRGAAVRDKAGKGEAPDLVTEADLVADGLISRALEEAMPEHALVSEERPRPEGVEDGCCFILDPIDGTHNAIAGLPLWCLSLARVEQGVVEEGWILDAHGRLTHALRGRGAWCDGRPLRIPDVPTNRSLLSVGLSPALVPLLLASDLWAGVRALGSHALALSWVSEGRLAVHAGRGWPWDHAAGWLLVQEAGGRVCDLEGRPRDLWAREQTLAGSPRAVDLCLEILQRGEPTD
jgi:myo-inositol-1(or 4)-monophosphatase